MIRLTLAAVATTLVVAASPAHSNSLKYSFQGELRVLDPYSLRETFTLGTLSNVYEGLVARDTDMNLIPALATSWEIVEPTRWRFHLRRNVRFHSGNPFTADDVVFSADRLRSEESNLKSMLDADVAVVKIDDFTVDFVLPEPNPILHAEWEFWVIMDKEWTEETGSVAVTSAASPGRNHAARHANGTGPFRIVSHEPGLKTVFQVNPDWWNNAQRLHNLSRIEFTPISNDATRAAALLSGDVDLIMPLPVQDIARIQENDTIDALVGRELRTVFLGFDQFRDELLYSSVKGRNPFKDLRVRKAFYQAIDVAAIRDRTMRGRSTPAALMISPQLFSRAGEFDRYPYDPDEARRLLGEAGYPDGFQVTLDCPNDRYVNDEEICRAVASMLAKVGIDVSVNAQPKSRYFGRITARGGYDTSFYLLGWSPASLDSQSVLANLANCRNAAQQRGLYNIGGYCNTRLDALTRKIRVEIDAAERDALIAEAFRLAHDEVAYIPLHQQNLAWGVSNRISLEQRPDNVLRFSRVRIRETD